MPGTRAGRLGRRRARVDALDHVDDQGQRSRRCGRSSSSLPVGPSTGTGTTPAARPPDRTSRRCPPNPMSLPPICSVTRRVSGVEPVELRRVRRRRHALRVATCRRSGRRCRSHPGASGRAAWRAASGSCSSTSGSPTAAPASGSADRRRTSPRAPRTSSDRRRPATPARRGRKDDSGGDEGRTEATAAGPSRWRSVAVARGTRTAPPRPLVDRALRARGLPGRRGPRPGLVTLSAAVRGGGRTLGTRTALDDVGDRPHAVEVGAQPDGSTLRAHRLRHLGGDLERGRGRRRGDAVRRNLRRPEAGVELRVMHRLTPLRDVWSTSLHASGIRLRHAQDW